MPGHGQIMTNHCGRWAHIVVVVVALDVLSALSLFPTIAFVILLASVLFLGRPISLGTSRVLVQRPGR